MNHLPHRKSIRMPRFDYRLPFWYFLTLCTDHRRMVFGEIRSGVIHLNNWGKIVEEEFLSSEAMRDFLICDQYVVMPNHLHGIIGFDRKAVDKTLRSRATAGRPYKPKGPHSSSLSAFVAGYKSSVTRRIRAKANNPALTIWQRGYYEHVIRNDRELHMIREYIEMNPHRWDADPENTQISETASRLPWEQ